MKIKTHYIYIAIIVIFVAFLFIQNSSEKKLETHIHQQNQLPHDHPPIDGMTNNNEEPSKKNVSQNFYDEIENLKKEIEQSPNDVDKMLKLANFLFDAHKLDEAEFYYKKILSVDKKNISARLYYANLLFPKRDYEKTISLMKEILSIDKKNISAMYNLGALNATINNYEEAKNWWQKVLSIDSTSHDSQMAKDGLKKLETMFETK